MKIILLENVKRLGGKGEIVEVKEGQARNFLIPKKLTLDVRASDNFLAELDYTKIIANKPLKMLFSIPKKYVEIK